MLFMASASSFLDKNHLLAFYLSLISTQQFKKILKKKLIFKKIFKIFLKEILEVKYLRIRATNQINY